jgi:ABC transport system ATP-binding/permease protein
LIFDEPTNDLDLATLQILEEGLADFEGCVLVVSHDRWFLNRVCTHILAFEDDGRVDFHVGDYDRYLEKRRATPAPADEPKQERVAKTRTRKLSYKEQKELEGMEETILAVEEEVATLEGLLNDPQFFVTRSQEFPEVEAKLAVARSRVTTLYARWQELEAIRAGA